MNSSFSSQVGNIRNCHKDQDEKDLSLTSFNKFTPNIKKSSQLRETLLKNGPHCVSLLQLKSLEPFLPRRTEIMLKSVCNSFKQGWLFDEVINSYFWCLENSNPSILYAPSTSMMVMQKGVPCGQLWKDVNIFLKKFIIAPWNPTDYHWTLVAVDLQEKKIIYLDPLQNVKDDSRFLQLLSTFMPHILQDKFGLCDFVVVSSPHTLQTDLKSCGVLVCWYALQLINDKPLTEPCNENAMRQLIYNTIQGSCLKARSGFHIDLSKCPLCTNVVESKEEEMQCDRCFQQYHRACYDVSDGVTNIAAKFYCQPMDVN